MVSREVVQPTGSGEVERLNAALNRLAANPRDVTSLIDAGHAAMQLDDLEAAIGFFSRAQELSPASPQAKLGMAAALVRSRQPNEALRLFAEAQLAGAAMESVAADHGLALDLVGNNAEAQASYRLALARRSDDEVSRRLAISLAISGDRAGFEEKVSCPSPTIFASSLLLLSAVSGSLGLVPQNRSSSVPKFPSPAVSPLT